MIIIFRSKIEIFVILQMRDTLIDTLLWIIAFIVTCIASLEIVHSIPKPTNDYSRYWSENAKSTEFNVSDCCIATIFDSSTYRNAVALGYSLQQLGIPGIRAYSFSQSLFSDDQLAILNHLYNFTHYSPSNLSGSSSDELYFSLNDCNAVIAVSPRGVFYSFPYKACLSPGFSAVPQSQDITSYDPSSVSYTHLTLPTTERV